MFKLVKEIKSQKGALHFKRWSIFSSRWFNIYLHFINKEDEDEHMHTHPWNFWSIILKGGYIEYTESGSVRREFLHTAYRKSYTPHKIGILINPTWSLVVTGSGGKSWGFKTENGIINNEEYRKLKKNKNEVS